MIQTSVGENVRVGTLQYTMRLYVLRAHHEVLYGVDVEENDGFMSEDDPWCLKNGLQQKITKHQEQRYNDKVISKKRKRENISWVMGNSGLILKHNNIFSVQTQFLSYIHYYIQLHPYFFCNIQFFFFSFLLNLCRRGNR